MPCHKQALVKEPKEEGIKKNSTAVNKFLEELVKIGTGFVFVFLFSAQLVACLSIYASISCDRSVCASYV